MPPEDKAEACTPTVGQGSEGKAMKERLPVRVTGVLARGCLSIRKGTSVSQIWHR